MFYFYHHLCWTSPQLLPVFLFSLHFYFDFYLLSSQDNFFCFFFLSFWGIFFFFLGVFMKYECWQWRPRKLPLGWHQGKDKKKIENEPSFFFFFLNFLVVYFILYREAHKYLHMVFVDLEKAYDRVCREIMCWILGKKGVPPKYIRDIYDRAVISIRKSGCFKSKFPITIGLH